jgi:hypothetical protein
VVALKLDATTDAKIVVELDIFSGRPNPEWRLAPAAGTRLLDLLRAANTTTTPAAAPGLGYRGLTLRIGRNDTIRVGHGIIEAGGVSYRDDGRAVEAFLLQSMPDDLKAQFDSVLPRSLR